MDAKYVGEAVVGAAGFVVRRLKDGVPDFQNIAGLRRSIYCVSFSGLIGVGICLLPEDICRVDIN